jgi:hypothetical protein
MGRAEQAKITHGTIIPDPSRPGDFRLFAKKFSLISAPHGLGKLC